MNHKGAIVVFCCALISRACCGVAWAQHDSSRVRHKMDMRDVYVHWGGGAQSKENGTRNDFHTLAPSAGVFSSNLSGYEESNAINGSACLFVSAGAGFNFADKLKNYYKPSPQLRLALSYYQSSYLSYNLHKRDLKPVDTLISSQTGQTYYIDSVYVSRYNMNYISGLLRIEASLLFRTDRMKRFSIYGGAGIASGISVNAFTRIEFRSRAYVTTEGSSVNNGSAYQVNSRGKDTLITQQFRNKGGWGYSVFFPLGLDFRIGTKREFWKHTCIFIESQAFITSVYIPELRGVKSVGLLNTFGVRAALY